MKLKHRIITYIAVGVGLSLSAKNTNPNRINLGPMPAFASSGGSSFRLKDESGKEGPRQVVKMNVSQLVLKNLSFQYELGFHKNLSLGLGVNFVLSRTLPDFFSADDSTMIRLPDPKLSGWAITPEFRFYPGSKQERVAPHGFYLAAYFRYARYALTSSYTLRFINNVDYGYDFKASYKGYTSGLMLGYQWLIGKHFSIDFWIAGGGAGQARLEMNVLSNGFEMDAQQQEELKTTLENEFADLRLLNLQPTITTTGNSAQAKANGVPMLSFRGLGLCLGFAF